MPVLMSYSSEKSQYITRRLDIYVYVSRNAVTVVLQLQTYVSAKSVLFQGNWAQPRCGVCVEVLPTITRRLQLQTSVLNSNVSFKRLGFAMFEQDALQVAVFTCSNEAFAAEELLTAFRSNEAAQISKLITPNRYIPSCMSI